MIFKMRLSLPLPLALLATCIVPAVLGHTWIEQMRAIDDTGKYVGEYGYPRGFKSKHAKDYNSETDMVYLLPPISTQHPFINASHLLCHEKQRKPVQGTRPEQGDTWPRLQAPPGGWVALRYAENGHVSNPSTKGQLNGGRREKGGSVFIFGTTEPKEDEKIVDVLRWTKDGQGGDKRGVLLAVNDYDDGRCYEINPLTGDRQKQTPNFAMGQAQEGAPGGYPLYCESDVQLPENAPSGKPYTLYWVWQWPMDPKMPGNPFKDGKDEYYTTCMDVDVGDTVQQSASQFALEQQDAMEEAVPQYKSRTALLTDPIEGEIGPVFGGQGNGSAQPTATPAPSGGAPQNPSQSAAAPTPTGDAPMNSQPVPAPSAPPSPTGDASTSPQLPAATSNAPSPSQNTLATSPSAPASQNTEVPTLTQRPGDKPSASAPPADDDVVRITVTSQITITASSAAEPTSAAPSKRAEHLARHQIRGRGFFGA